MRIERFPALPAFLLEQLIPFNQAPLPDWALLYDASEALRTAHPESEFSSAPYLYIDLRGQTCGLIFREQATDELFYVHREAEGSS
ncbi:hypothetical protein [Marinobacterium mangrovicola]|uniref:Uncharacterized protein n=1 Tax=Marinobacterium mangrovicola TaxID=1476959 RepID=A0A4R1GCV1_9GAMM|nr:hypothetical protein [Marinobacterium mangrovicola]TCK05884.1 hypothetical protein CLV83_2825 [Marinobacterium mangrovicola]